MHNACLHMFRGNISMHEYSRRGVIVEESNLCYNYLWPIVCIMKERNFNATNLRIEISLLHNTNNRPEVIVTQVALFHYHASSAILMHGNVTSKHVQTRIMHLIV